MASEMMTIVVKTGSSLTETFQSSPQHLAMLSPVFEAMLTAPMREARDKTVILEDVNPRYLII